VAEDYRLRQIGDLMPLLATEREREREREREDDGNKNEWELTILRWIDSSYTPSLLCLASFV